MTEHVITFQEYEFKYKNGAWLLKYPNKEYLGFMGAIKGRNDWTDEINFRTTSGGQPIICLTTQSGTEYEGLLTNIEKEVHQEFLNKLSNMDVSDD